MNFLTESQPAASVRTFPRLGEPAPLFEAESTFGKIRLSDYRGKWVVLFSHPEDFTPICTSEIIAFADIQPLLREMNCHLIGLSTDSNRTHIAWLNTIEEFTNQKIDFPVIADTDKKVAASYGMIMPVESRTETARCLFIIDENQIIRAIQYYPASTGRNTSEIVRLVQALQISSNKKVATPANWQPGRITINCLSPYYK
jgi:peroxiredoxin (alkyl hydroperoxide reductase subunit C)